MTDHDALLAAVLADPAADLPRLVYADFLEEAGHPALAARAHFIRHQVEAERLPDPSPERTSHEQASAELLALHGAGWLRAFPEWVSWPDTEVHYRRGFVETLVTTPRRLDRDGPGLFAVAPVTALQLRNRNARPDLAAHLFDEAITSRVTSLRIGPGYECTELAENRVGRIDLPISLLLHALRQFEAVSRLTMSGNALDDGCVVQLVSQLPDLPLAVGLRELDLSDNPISDPGACTLYAARGLDQLDRLNLTRTRIIPGGPGDLLLRRRLGDRVVL